MRHIERLQEPKKLADKHAEWQRLYDAERAQNPEKRPSSAKYAHKSIRNVLDACSYGKCFYCESKLRGVPSEVDHFIEVTIKPELAFTWDNLYLSCSNCNDKADHNAIPVDTALDPCRDSDEEIQRHITFENECIYSVAGSIKGTQTIKKYHLNKEALDLKRSKRLQVVSRKIIDIYGQMQKEHRFSPTPEERERIKRFMQPDQPYSLMCEIYLKRVCPSWIV